ncbi:hypothetical protein REPUB_Repub12eG0157900 [Reevesia pubescens]
MGSVNSNNDIVGYRFHPTDKELVDHYLWNKILGRDSLVQAIKQVDGLFNKDPCELPCCSNIKSADQVWYFFSRREDNKRVKRTTDKGFWKVTGKPRSVKGKRGIAVKKTLVYYEGRTPNAKWTPWVMHEYIFTSTLLDNKEGVFLCKLKNKEDEKADTPSSESFQPSQVADDDIPENSELFNPDKMLATLEEPYGRDETESNFSLTKQLPIHEDQVPFCEEFTHMYDLSGAYEGSQYQSSSNEENDESWIRYLGDNDELSLDERSNEQVVENEGCKSSVVDITCPGESSRKRSRFEDDVLCGAIENEECQAENDESWLRYLGDNDELSPDERSNEQVVENEGCKSLVVDITCPGESSRKRSRFEEDVLCGAIENEKCQAENDESWLRYLVNNDELSPDERSNEQVVENEGCKSPVVDITCAGESSRKRSRFEDDVLCGAIENEDCQATVKNYPLEYYNK